MNKQEKKRAYNERIIKIKHGSFTQLVLSIKGSMGRECQTFNSRLAQLISEKEIFCSIFRVTGFEQKFALDYESQICFV